MSKYSKNTSGVSEKVFVAPNVPFTAQTTYAAFVTNTTEADGTIGVFLDTLAVKTTALTAGQNFFIAQKRDGNTQRTPIISWNDLRTKVRSAYQAQAAQVSSLGYNTTNTASDLGFVFAGAAVNNTLTYGIVARETTPGNQPFPVQEGYATTTTTTADQYSVLSAMVAQFNFSLDYERAAPDAFVIAEIQQSSTGTAITGSTSVAVTNASPIIVFNTAPTGAPAVGGLIALGATGNNGVVYKIVSINADTVTYTLDRTYTGVTNGALAIANALNISAYVSGTTRLGVRFTAIDPSSTFVVNGTGGLLNAPVLKTTQWVFGSGYGSNIVDLEKQGNIFDGAGANLNVAFSLDYGIPTRYASAALTYDQIFLMFAPAMFPGANPVNYLTNQVERLHLVSVVGSTTGSTFQTIFGL